MNNLISVGGNDLVDMYTAGNAAALTELQRRFDKNGRATTGKQIEACTGSTPDVAEQPKIDASCISQVGGHDLAQLLLALMAQSPSAEMSRDQLKDAFKGAFVGTGTPAKATKKKAKRDDALPTGPTGVNVITEMTDEGWKTYSTGIGDRNGSITPHEGELSYIGELVGTGDTAKDAKAGFYGNLKHYLPRPFRTTVDSRGTKATPKNSTGMAPIEMSRDQLKAALGLPSSSKMRTAKMVDMVGEAAVILEEAKAQPTVVNNSIEALLKGLDITNALVG